MMSNILVVIYSYKGKILKDVINQIELSKSNNNSVNIVLWDQNPLDRKKIFNNVIYNHIFWDQITSPSVYKNLSIKKYNYDYILFLSDNVLLSNNWDEKIINLLNNKNIILSGNSKFKINKKNFYSIEKENIESINDITITNFIDKSFIFGNRKTFEEIYFPPYIKYFGEEEVLSIDIFSKGIDIYAVPTEIYSKVLPDLITEIYVPFSLNHGYNHALSLFKNNKNQFIDLTQRKRTVKDFCNFHNFMFNSLNYLPFFTDDVQYDPYGLNFDKVDARRFVARTKAIH